MIAIWDTAWAFTHYSAPLVNQSNQTHFATALKLLVHKLKIIARICIQILLLRNRLSQSYRKEYVDFETRLMDTQTAELSDLALKSQGNWKRMMAEKLFYDKIYFFQQISFLTQTTDIEVYINN